MVGVGGERREGYLDLEDCIRSKSITCVEDFETIVLADTWQTTRLAPKRHTTL